MIDIGRGKKLSHGTVERPEFGDIVGQRECKRALLAVAANDDLDGLLLRGEKGTAKSTAVRALAGLLPEQPVVADCPFGCHPAEPELQCVDCQQRADHPTEQRPVPLVTLPLGATRERVVGTLSVADALEGDHEFDPGLLARAHRGILYVDEVNLLDDHLVDVLLDAAASGTNRVERDGVSVAHPAEFTLIGTMNPEEGDLRPQLRDRFALQATVTGCDDLEDRVEIIDRAIGRDGAEGASANASGQRSTEERREQLETAREILPDVELADEFAREIATLCRDAGLEGHRGDIATARAARTFAALDRRETVLESDVRRAAELALPHRLRSQPFEDAPDAEDLIDEQFDGAEDEGAAGDGTAEAGDGDGTAEAGDVDETERGDGNEREGGDEGSGDDDRGEEPPDGSGDDESTSEESAGQGVAEPGSGDGDGTTDGAGDEPERGHDGATADGSLGGGEDGEESAGGESTGGTDPESGGSQDEDASDGTPLVPGQSAAGIGDGRGPELDVPDASSRAGGSGKGGARTRTEPHVDAEGARIREQRAESSRRIDAAASVRAASARGASAVESRDLRQSVRQQEAGALVVFAVDASASMRAPMQAAKGTVLELLEEAYQHRDEVAFVAFAGEDAEVLLPPTDSVTLAARHLKDLPTGDRTPLPAGIESAADVLERADPAAGVVVLVTDGRANVADGSPVEATRAAARRLAGQDATVVVVDAGEGGRSNLTGVIAAETDGERVPLEALTAERVDAAVGATSTTQS